MKRFEAWVLPTSLGPGASSDLGAGDSAASAFHQFNAGDVEVTYPVLTAGDVAGVCDALREARHHVSTRPVDEVVSVLGAVGRRFLSEGDAVRLEALSLLPATSGLSPEMSVAVLDGMARDWTEERIRRMLEIELDDIRVLDDFVTIRGRRAMAIGPHLCVQIVAGSVPGVGVSALIRSLVVKSPTLLKPGRGDVILPVLFARALAEVDAELADLLAIVYWPGGSDALEGAALDAADVVTVYGSDRTVAAVRSRAPVASRVVAYHHRVSVGAVGREALSDELVEATAADVALSASFFDQRGCVSPHVIYVEEGGRLAAAAFGQRLAEAFGQIERRLPGGTLDVDEAAALQQLRGTAELMAASGAGEVLTGGKDATWTVVVGDEGGAEACVGRSVSVQPIRDLLELPHLLTPIASHLQTVGVAGFGDRLEEFASACGRVGVSRVVPFVSVAFPEPWWYHDGRGPITDLVRWVELEAAPAGETPA